MITFGYKEVEAYISKYLDFKININPNYYYYKFPNFITCSMNSIKNKYSNIYSYGIKIISIKKREITLLPSILQCLNNLSIKTVDLETAIKISYNKIVKMNSLYKQLIIKDVYDRFIAFGEILNSKFIPIVTIGEYLKIEK